jgi:hypothetical protein
VFVANLAERFWSQVNRADADACWLWTGRVSRDGYGTVSDGRPLRAHRVAYELTHGPIAPGLCVMHRCDRPLCVNPRHLSLGTNADNSRDMCGKKRQATGARHGSHTNPEQWARGERQGLSKLTEDDVRRMRTMHASGSRSLYSLAAEFHISRPQVANIVSGRQWKHVPQTTA